MPTETITLNMGPQHPSTHGVLHVLLELDGEIVKSADASLGYLHRGFEKLAENRTYQAVLTLTDRCDYLNAMGNELGWCLAVEDLLGGVEVPPRAQALRVVMAELDRIASHLLWLGTFGLDVGALTPFLYCMRERETINDLFEEVCGARLTFNYLRIGGVSRDLPAGWVDRAQAFLDRFPARVDEYERLLTDNEIFRRRLMGIAPLTVEQCMEYGVTGPMLRATGLAWDLRKDDPYSGYEQYEFDVPTGRVGDCYDRYLVRVREMRESAKIVRQALDSLPDGEISAKLPKTIKPPQGEVFRLVESPRGHLGYYLISDGGKTPYRVRMRAPSFSNLSVINDLLSGYKIGDVVAIIGTIDIVLGEVDR